MGYITIRGRSITPLSMEAEAFLHHDDNGVVGYKFQLLGPGPASGCDIYNAVDSVERPMLIYLVTPLLTDFPTYISTQRTLRKCIGTPL